MNNVPIHVLLNFYGKEIDEFIKQCEQELKIPKHIGNTNFGFTKEDFKL